VLTRRSPSDPSDLAFFYCHVPEGRPVSLPVLIWLAGKRWPVEECLQQGKGQAGLDQHQVRLWHSFHRHTVLSMCAQALLAVAAARRAPRAGSPSHDTVAGQPATWVTPGHDGADAIRPGPDGTTTTPGSKPPA
jgi:hypothetical protein